MLSNRHISKGNPSRLRKYLLAIFILAAGLGGTAYFAQNLIQLQKVHAPTSQASLSDDASENSAKTLSKSLPIRLKITRLGINAPILQLGLNSDNTLGTPNSPTDVGWYKNSPTPGETGPSIIVGHVDYVNYGPAVFWDLHKLIPGDVIEIKRADGSVAIFKVDSVKQFSQSNFPTDKVYGNTDYAGLRLITCGGTFNSQTGHYSDNTVVFGRLITG